MSFDRLDALAKQLKRFTIKQLRDAAECESTTVSGWRARRLDAGQIKCLNPMEAHSKSRLKMFMWVEKSAPDAPVPTSVWNYADMIASEMGVPPSVL